MKREKPMLYIGCPMWGYKDWVGRFFPPKTPASEFLRLYSRKLTAVEGNTTFYAVPNEETVMRWRDETPPTFRFCFKLPRAISHETFLEGGKAQVEAFLTRLAFLQERLGTFFLQLPPSFSPAHLDQLESFLANWPPSYRLAIEVRHPDFFEEPHAARLNELLKQHHMTRVLMDTRPIRTGPAKEQQLLKARERKPDLPVHITVTSDVAFVRYIGHPRAEVNQPFLENWGRLFAHWLDEGVTIYAFCHCPFEVNSPFICQQLYERVSAYTSLPPLPWSASHKSDEPEQGRLF